MAALNEFYSWNSFRMIAVVEIAFHNLIVALLIKLGMLATRS